MVYLIRRFLIPVSLMLATSLAFGETPFQNQHLDRNDFVIGESYQIIIRSHEAPGIAEGQLLKVTKDWIVLGTVESYGTVRGRDWLMKLRYGSNVAYWLIDLPIVGPLVSKSENHRVKKYLWIPRETVQVQNHSEILDPATKEPFVDDTPTLENSGRVCWMEKSKLSTEGFDLKEGELKKVENGEIRVTAWVEESHKSDSGKNKSATRKVEKTIPFADVVFIQTQVEISREEIKSR